ncbi:hypothetical protein ES708_31820 [subsurface metagenome]
MSETIYLIRLFCQVCITQTLHIRTSHGGLECLECRAAGREKIPVTHYPDASSPLPGEKKDWGEPYPADNP